MRPLAPASWLTAVSLFTGIGALDLACQRAGIGVAAAVEIDPGCRGVLARHFPHTTLFCDVTEVTGEQLRATGFVPSRGVLTAGWPCQGNSVAGRRGGLADPRSGLWRHVVRLMAETRPRWFVGENVPGLLSIDHGHDFVSILADLDELGYGVAWRVLDAQWFGVPQRRRRVFLVGCLGDPCGPVQILLEPESGGGHPAQSRQEEPHAAGTVGSRADGSRTTDLDGHGAHIVSTLQGGGRRGHRVDAEAAAGGHLLPIPLAARGRDGGSQIETGHPTDSAFALRTPDGGASYPVVAHGLTSHHGRNDVEQTWVAHALTAEAADASEDGTGRGTPLVPVFVPAVRRLTPRECERLQGFPDDWTRWLADRREQSDSARYRELGNAVAVPVATWIACRLAVVAAAAADQPSTGGFDE